MAMSRLLMPVVAAVAAALLVPLPGLAQSGPGLEVAVGVGGYVTPNRPAEVRATITSPVLVAGRLRLRGADIVVSRPVEVPAGGRQTYSLHVPPLEDGTRLTVEVLDAGGDVLVTDRLVLRWPERDAMSVGVVGSDGLVNTLGRVRSVVTGRPVATVSISGELGDDRIGVLDYLILTREAADQLDAALDWVQGGGRLVVDPSLAPGLGEPIPTGVPDVGILAVGSGEVVMVGSLETRSSTDWASILRPTPLNLGSSPEFGLGSPLGLVQAASETGSRQVPSLPWLLFAILGFAVLVGPVNFFVLSRLARRDWAWVTIPALSLLAVAGFWVAGRQRLAGTDLAHASVIVAESGVRARSAVLVAAGASGERTLTFGPDATVYPERSLFGSEGIELRLEGDDSARVQLDQLGFTGVGVTVALPRSELPRVSVADGKLEVDNTTGFTFWGWGAMLGGSSSLAGEELARGAKGEVEVPAGRGGDFGFSFIDALMNQRELWNDPVRSSSLWSLGQVLSAEIDDGAMYFVGITDDYTPPVEVAGGASRSPGPTIVLVAVPDLSGGDPGSGRSGAQVVGTGLIHWLDWGVERVISTDELTLRFDIPIDAVGPRLTDNQRFGVPPSAYQAWDWDREEFVDIDLGAALEASHVSPNGEVYVRLVGGNEFGDNPMSPSTVFVEWKA